MVVGGGSHLGSSSRHCPCPFTLWAVIFVCACSSALMHVCFHSRAVTFIHGGDLHLWAVAFAFMFVHGQLGSLLSGLERLGSFLGIRVCSWAVLTLMRCGGGGPLVGGGGGCSLWQLQCLSHACRIWEDRCRGWDVFSFCFMYNKAFMAQVA